MAPNRVIRVAIVGGGISGIAQAVRLIELLGDQVEFTIYERGTSPGGVWRDSTWPGAGVDVPIHLYQLYSELNPQWSEKYARQVEVLAYWESIIDKFGFRDRFVFSANFTGSHWDIDSQSHTLTFDLPEGKTLQVVADVLISASGALNSPLIPKLEGLESFKGVQWHSSRWNKDFDLSGKKVAVVGNGSSGIQVLPNIATVPGIEITQFFRSPGYFKPKINFQYSALTRWAFKWIPGFQRLQRWSLFYEYELANLTKGNSIWSTKQRLTATTSLLSYLRATAPQKYLDILIPDYPLHLKRAAYDQGYLASLHLPNVSLTNSAITSVSPTGLVTADGVQHDFDVIVWATGFDVSGTGVGLNHGVYGEEGKELHQIWEENEGAYAYKGVSVPKFPNYFIVLGPNAISQSWGFTLGNQTNFIARLIKGLVDHRFTSISPRVDVTSLYNVGLQKRLGAGVLGSDLATSWYKHNQTGKVVAPSGHAALELVLKTRKIRWEDWVAKGPEGVGKEKIVALRTPASWSPWTWAKDAWAEWLQAKLIALTYDAEA